MFDKGIVAFIIQLPWFDAWLSIARSGSAIVEATRLVLTS